MITAVAGCSSTSAVARVNGEDITSEQFERIYEQAISGYELSAEESTEFRKSILGWLVEATLVIQDAEQLGADLSEETIQADLEDLASTMTTDMAEFETIVAQYGMTMDDLRFSIKEERARAFLAEYLAENPVDAELPETYSLLEHILVDPADEATATALYEQVIDGADFAALAEEFSIDPGSAAQGGRLAWSPTTAYVAEFRDAADALAVGEVSEPVQSDFGWHIIRKADEVAAGTAAADLPDDLTVALEASGTDLMLQAYIETLRASAEIEYLDETLKP
jgi:foldase protein PrsA